MGGHGDASDVTGCWVSHLSWRNGGSWGGLWLTKPERMRVLKPAAFASWEPDFACPNLLSPFGDKKATR